MHKKRNIIIFSVIFICLLFLLVNKYNISKNFYNIHPNGKIKANVQFTTPILNQNQYKLFNVMLENGETILLGGEKKEKLSLLKGDKISVKIKGHPILAESEKNVSNKALSVKLIKSNIIINENDTYDTLKSPSEDITLEVLENGKYYIAITNFSTNFFYIEKITYGK